VIVVGGIGREVRGGVFPLGVFVSPTATGAGALLQAMESASKSKIALIKIVVVWRRTEVRKDDCILADSRIRMKSSGILAGETVQ
jgi:hypothetical protein